MNYRRGMLTLLATVLLGTLYCQGQQQKAAGLHPVFSTSLGNVVSNQKLPASLMKSLLDSVLVARDSTGHAYPVISFTFGYATTNAFVNDTTGKPTSSRTYLSFHFKGNRLDALWRKGIAEKIKTGDVLYFDRIIAEGPKKLHYLAAPLQYSVE